MPILAPLPNAPVHFMQTERICFLQAHLLRVLPLRAGDAATVPRIIAQTRHPIAKMVQRRRSRTAGVLPLPFRGQPVSRSILLAQTTAEFLSIDPTHETRRVLRSFPVWAVPYNTGRGRNNAEQPWKGFYSKLRIAFSRRAAAEIEYLLPTLLQRLLAEFRTHLIDVLGHRIDKAAVLGVSRIELRTESRASS